MMRGKMLGRLLVALIAVSLALGATAPAALAGGVHDQKTPPDVPGFDGKTIKLGVRSRTATACTGSPRTLKVAWVGSTRSS
jgi:hypothetical protein